MQQIARQLKEAREEQGITLEMLHQRTKIRIRYLQAIETGAFHLVPGQVYLKGFIRSYARVVGVDAEPLLKEYDQTSGESAAPERAVPAGRFARLSQGVRQGVEGTLHRFGH